jgi:hypothetical protein
MKELAALASLLLLAACAPSASVTPSPSSNAPESSESTAAACAAPPTVCDGPLGAGDYISEGTGARIAFTLDEHDWSGLADTPGDGFALFLADVPNGGIYVTGFSGEVFDDPCAQSPAATSTIGTSPADFMTFLGASPGITLSEPNEVEVGGRPALEASLTVDFATGCPNGSGFAYWLYRLPVHGDLHLGDGERDRVLAVDGGSGTVIIWIGVWSPDEDYDHLLEHGAEVVESMVIAPL